MLLRSSTADGMCAWLVSPLESNWNPPPNSDVQVFVAFGHATDSPGMVLHLNFERKNGLQHAVHMLEAKTLRGQKEQRTRRKHHQKSTGFGFLQVA